MHIPSFRHSLNRSQLEAILCSEQHFGYISTKYRPLMIVHYSVYQLLTVLSNLAYSLINQERSVPSRHMCLVHVLSSTYFRNLDVARISEEENFLLILIGIGTTVQNTWDTRKVFSSALTEGI